MKFTNNRIQPIIDELIGLEDPDDMMLKIIEALDTDKTWVPEVDKYYTFIYIPKTSGIQYDQYPLIRVTEITSWGFKGLNFHHGGELRFYTFPEVQGQMHLVKETELEDLLSIPYGLIRQS